MKRKLAILLSIFVFFSFININVYATGNDKEPKPITVKLNGETLDFDTDPIIINNRTMLPMRAIFEKLGAKVSWHEEVKTVTGYRRYKDVSDMFIKLKIGDDTAYRNGKGFSLDSPPVIKNSRTLVPVRFIAESFGVEVDWDDENRTVLLDYDVDKIKDPELVDDVSYISQKLDYGVNLMIPEYWDKSSDSNKFGYQDEGNNIQMFVDIVEFEESKTLDQFTEESKSSILDTFKDKVIFTGSDKVNVNNININVVYLKNSSITPEINQVVYYFMHSSYGYKITFSYYSEDNDSQLLNVISNIINTIEIRGVTINTKEEHYIEYDPFFNYEIDLNSEIYSSMEVENEFDFTGSINSEKNLKYFIITVSKGTEKNELKIPVKDYKFDSKIYTPFKLGKHNITVKTPKSQDKVMQFSVINTSTQDIRYLIPSKLVEKDDSEIVDLANDITKDIDKYLPEYDKSKAIFEWICKNIEYDSKSTNSIPRSAKKVLADKKGTNEELSYLYAALLRASGIPSKIVKGTNDDDEHVWNEIQINGKWIIADVTLGNSSTNNKAVSNDEDINNNSDIANDNKVITDDGITIDDEAFNQDHPVGQKVDMNYFDATRSDYEDKFSEIKILGY